MSLPFLQHKRIQSVIMGRKKEGSSMELPEAEHPLSSAAEDLIHAVHSKDVGGVARALEASHQISSAQPEDSHE